MIIVKKILVPTDYSSVSLAAIRYALSIAHDHSAEVMVLHAVPVSALKEPSFASYTATEGITPGSPMPPPREPPSVGDLLTVKKQHLMGFLRDRIEPDLLKGVKITPLAKLGAAVHEIVATAKEEQCDMVVMGSRGKSRLGRLISSSLTEQVIRSAPCPVLSIQPSAQVQTDEGEWIQSIQLGASAAHI